MSATASAGSPPRACVIPEVKPGWIAPPNSGRIPSTDGADQVTSQSQHYCNSSGCICTDQSSRYMEPDVLERILDGREKPTNLPLALLKNITVNFSKEREIGHGGFATVYKGVLSNGNVAVKRIRNNHTIDERLFYREVDSLMAINHQNIVQFVGFCASTDQTAIKIEGSREHIYAEIRERLLCFEYISNGSLQKCITDELRGLDWSTRYRLIKGICDGLHYLHMEKHIYHMDLKPANILLDTDMVPKITDFGLSRLDEKSQTMSVDRCGSLGYCAPEYLQSGKMSFKSDMYSLGVIIIELVTGEKSIPYNNKDNLVSIMVKHCI
uniref:Uncharacterized protein n=1 Tax=Avena sativa TaxID=4498 RepID=A0ACD5Y9N6_AVESA